MMGDPVPGKWLGQVFDDCVAAVPALALAYDFPSYPGAPFGLGRWADLWVDRLGQSPIGRLWTNDRDGCGIESLPGGNPDLYTAEVLQLRLDRRNGTRASAAFDAALARHRHSRPAHTTDLSAVLPRE